MDNGYRIYSKLPFVGKNKVYCEINLSALVHNYRVLCEKTDAGKPDCRKICVVKADAYGHGAEKCAEALYDAGCDFFAVSSLQEAVALREVFDRKGKRHPEILILGYTPAEDISLLSKYRIIQTVFSEEYALEAEKYAAESHVNISIHIKLDTGMNRIGFPTDNPESIKKTASVINELLGNGTRFRHLEAKGVLTHFAKADEYDGEIPTDKQYARFERTLTEAFGSDGNPGLLCHVCNSAASVRFPDYYSDAVRYGIMLYGGGNIDDQMLLPVMKVKSLIAHIHLLKSGESVGYGGEYTAKSDRIIATIPAGYADGIMRAASGAEITVCHKNGDGSVSKYKVKTVGRVCMDQVMADITDIPANIGDEVIFFGDEPGDAGKFASKAHTIDYECMCNISSRVPRYYIGENKEKI